MKTMEREDVRRRRIKQFIQERGLKIKPWCNSAGIAESGLRNYLETRTASMTYDSLDRLARAAGATVTELVGDNVRMPLKEIIKDVQIIRDRNGKEMFAVIHWADYQRLIV